MLRIEDNLVAVSPADSGSGNACRAAAQVLVCLLDLDLGGEVGGSGRETGDGTLVAVAHSTNKCRADGSGGGGGRVQAQCRKWIEVGGVDDRGSGRLIRCGLWALESTKIVVRHGGSGSGNGSGGSGSGSGGSGCCGSGSGRCGGCRGGGGGGSGSCKREEESEEKTKKWKIFIRWQIE